MKKIAICVLCLLSALLSWSQIPRPEYPRPQFERETWVNLNGNWTYKFDFVGSGIEHRYYESKGFEKTIVVPFAPESKLSGVEYTDFINHIWYQRNITIPANWSNKNILLNFGAIYYNSEIYLDGKLVGRHFGGSTSFSMDITKYVEAGKTHSLVVQASSDLRSEKQTAGKQSLRLNQFECMYTRNTGIWQTVWMEAVSNGALKQTQVITDIDQKQVIIHPQFYNENNGNKLKVTLKDNGKIVASETVLATNSTTLVLPIKKMKTWSPEDPFLYDLTYQVIDENNKTIDEISSYVGMRKVHIEGNKIYLNNKPFYQRLVLDQGFYPDGIWTAPSDAALKRDIELSMAAGFNGGRLHQKIFEERFHYWADKLGYITWGEAASWGMDANNAEAARNFISEWSEAVIRDRNHPSILIWTPMNEEWWPDKTQFPRFVENLYDITKNLDPTRPFHDVSGGVHVKTDIWSVHNYEQNPEKLKKAIWTDGNFQDTPLNIQGVITKNVGFNRLDYNNEYEYPKYDGKIPYLIDEVGGIKWAKGQGSSAGNSNNSWGYGEPPHSIEEFYTRLEGQIDGILEISDHVWGYCYTQLTDVEQEQNGIFFTIAHLSLT